MASIAPALRLLAAGCWQEAEEAARAVSDASPDNPHAMLLTGLAIAAMGEAERAAPVLTAVAAGQPGADHPCQDLAALKPALPVALVARQFRACQDLAPSDQRLRRAFARFLMDADDPAGAEALLVQMPGDATAHHLKGLARAELERFPLAISSFKIAVALNPSAAASWSNLGIVLKAEGDLQKALSAHDRAVTLDPGNPRFRVNRAVALLQAGAWERAWQDYEYRLSMAEAPAFDRSRLLPSLSDGVSLGGRTIVALHDQGFGDTLQFMRYLPLLADAGARVVACVPPELARVVRLVPGVAEVVCEGGLPAHEFVCPMDSLPRVFGTTIGTIPPMPHMAWPFAPHRRGPPRPGHRPTQGAAGVARTNRAMPGGALAIRSQGQEDVRHRRARRIGLSWAGQARPAAPGFNTLDRRRSAGLAAFAPLGALSGMEFVSLQMGPAARQPAPPGLVLEDAMARVTDFLDTAEIIASLDAVVSVDTSIVHLAGLVGTPVLMLDRYDGCWRWLPGRTDSPWYPRLRIFRQEQPGDWSVPMARIAAALEAGTVFSEIVTELA